MVTTDLDVRDADVRSVSTICGFSIFYSIIVLSFSHVNYHCKVSLKAKNSSLCLFLKMLVMQTLQSVPSIIQLSFRIRSFLSMI